MILPSRPGAIGSWLYSGVVQAQGVATRVITRGASPTFLMTKVCETLPLASLMDAEVKLWRSGRDDGTLTTLCDDEAHAEKEC